MSAELLSVRPAESDTTLVLKLSNPGARNALHPDMYTASIEAINTAERDTSVRVIVLTGADNFFCAGGNLNRLLENCACHRPQRRAVERTWPRGSKRGGTRIQGAPDSLR